MILGNPCRIKDAGQEHALERWLFEASQSESSSESGGQAAKSAARAALWAVLNLYRSFPQDGGFAGFSGPINR